MRYFRQILMTNWDNNRELKVTNNQVREKFKNIDTIEILFQK